MKTMYRSLLTVVEVHKCTDFIVTRAYSGNSCHEPGSPIVFKISYIFILRAFPVLDCDKTLFDPVVCVRKNQV